MLMVSPKVQKSVLGQIAAFAVLSTGAAGMQAQQTDAAVQATLPVQSYRLDSTAMPDVTNAPGVQYSSSSSSLDAAVQSATLELPTLPEAAQPAPRRRYGRPRYNDSSHNSDGSNKYGFLAGVGFTSPVEQQSNYLKTSYAFQVGAGRNFNKKASLFLQFDWDNFGFTGQTIANQTTIYDNILLGAGTPVDGNSHIWSFSLNPSYNFYSGEGLGAYVVGGVGFYHKVASFTTPVTGTGYDPYYGYIYQYQANETIDKYTSNAPGFNGGVGLTFKPSRFANERFYAEARYQYVLNSARSGYTVANYNQAFANSTNFFPQNSNRTSYFPIKFGIRF